MTGGHRRRPWSVQGCVPTRDRRGDFSKEDPERGNRGSPETIYSGVASKRTSGMTFSIGGLGTKEEIKRDVERSGRLCMKMNTINRGGDLTFEVLLHLKPD